MSGEGYCSRVAVFISENNALLACAARMSIAGFSEPLADRSMPRYLYFLTTWISDPLRRICMGLMGVLWLLKGINLVLMRLIFKSHMSQYSFSRSTARCMSWVVSERRTRSSANNNNRSLE